MSENEVREWPPVDLMAGLSLETTAEPELELDEKVVSGKAASCLASSNDLTALHARETLYSMFGFVSIIDHVLLFQDSR